MFRYKSLIEDKLKNTKTRKFVNLKIVERINNDKNIKNKYRFNV